MSSRSLHAKLQYPTLINTRVNCLGTMKNSQVYALANVMASLPEPFAYDFDTEQECLKMVQEQLQEDEDDMKAEENA